MGDRGAVVALIASLQDPEFGVRYHALVALERLDDARAVGPSLRSAFVSAAVHVPMALRVEGYGRSAVGGAQFGPVSVSARARYAASTGMRNDDVESPGLGGRAEAVDGPTHAETWLAIERAFDARREELGRGVVLATANPDEVGEGVPADDSVSPDGAVVLAPKCQWCDYGGLCGATARARRASGL